MIPAEPAARLTTSRRQWQPEQNRGELLGAAALRLDAAAPPHRQATSAASDCTFERRDCRAPPATTPTARRQRDGQREDFLYDIKGGGLRPPPAPAAGGRKRPSSRTPPRRQPRQATFRSRSAGSAVLLISRCRPCRRRLRHRRRLAA